MTAESGASKPGRDLDDDRPSPAAGDELDYARGDTTSVASKDDRADAGFSLEESDPDRRHAALQWSYAVGMILGAWLFATAFAIDYGRADSVPPEVLRITQERGLSDVEFRGRLLFWNDIFCGLVLAAAGLLSIFRKPIWAPWASTLVGLWLLMAPLLFWAPTAAVYLNQTLVGLLAIAFAIMIPGLPGFQAPRGPETPPGWNYNPSSWLQRAPIIAVALFGFFAARYLAAYQLGHLRQAWDPFFGTGTEKVLDSQISHAFPVSDAGLGAVSYVLEALTGFLGGRSRWRTMPWMVILFGILVVPLGVTSIVLVILQPIGVGYWCTICLATAAAMLVMVAPAMDEVVATCLFLARSRREGAPFWRTLFKGGTLKLSDSEKLPQRAPPTPWHDFLQGSGLTYAPWNLMVCAALGVWLMAAPEVLGYGEAAADSSQMSGALIVTIAVVAFGDIARAGRFLLLPLGAWLLAAPWLLEGATAASTASDLVAGGLSTALVWRRGKISDHFGRWDRWVF